MTLQEKAGEMQHKEEHAKLHDVFVVGGAGVDTIVRVPSLPLPVVDSIGVPPIRDYVAHTGNGVALGCHALGLKTKFIDFIGDDVEGGMILERYRQTGLDFSHLIHESGTRRSVNLVDDAGRRLSLYDGRHPYELRMPRAFWLPFLQAARHVHISIMPWARELYDDAIALGIPVSTDLHDWDGDNPYHREFALRSDLVFLSAANLGERRESVMRAILQQGRAQAVVVMAGSEGSWLLERDGEVKKFGCAQLGRAIVDTNGAGDSFVSAFLFSLLAGEPLVACMEAGAVSGAYACGVVGTHEEFITPPKLQHYLKARPFN